MLKNKKVVLIMTDSQRWDMINAYRNTGLQTPSLDRLAEEGVRFERAYTTQPLCQPARAGIFLGQYPCTVGSWGNTMGISQTCHNIGERVSKHGIRTAYMGKWHLDNGDYFGTGICPEGWDDEYWYDMKRYLDELSIGDRKRVRTLQTLREMDLPHEKMFAHHVSNRAVHFLEEHGEEEFLLVVSYDEPHGPYMCPAPYSKMYQDYDFPRDENLEDDLSQKPDHQKIWGAGNLDKDKATCQRVPHEFFGSNSYVDYEIGRVMDAIHEHSPEAVIIYTSDHGDALLSHNVTSKGPCTYDEVARIPFIVKGPDFPQGVVDTNPVSHIDIAPTILEMMGIEIPQIFPGESLVKELENPMTTRTNDYIFMEYGRYETPLDGFGGFQPLRSVYDGRYKLTINLLSTDELYDMQVDPSEMKNLINSEEYSKIRKQLHDVLLEHMRYIGDPFRGYYWMRRPWRSDAKEADWECAGIFCTKGIDAEYMPKHYNYNTGSPNE